MAPIRIGILGAAKIAPKAVIVPAAANPEFSVTAVAARDAVRAARFAAENGIPNVAGSYAELVERADVDLIYNALPPAGHADWTIRALEAGKAVLCEKPFAMNAAEAEAMVAAGERCRRPLLEAFHNRLHQAMCRAIEIVRSGELGDPIEAEALFDVAIARTATQLRWLPDQGGGALMDLGCYCVHALRNLAGCEPEISAARCTIVQGVDESTTADLAFPTGMKARIATSMSPRENRAVLHWRGSKGEMTIENFVAMKNCTFTVTANGKTRTEPSDGPTTYEAQLTHVGDVLLRGAASPIGGRNAVANMACIDAIYAAAGHTRPHRVD